MGKYDPIIIETGVLIVGHGLAGLAAAHAVRDADPNAFVLAVDKASLGYGGKANKGGGHISFIPPGNEETFVEYHVKNNGEYLNDQDTIRRYAHATVSTMDRWETWGAAFTGRDIAFNAHPTIPWKVCMVDGDILLKMAKKAEARGIQFMDKIDVVDLLVQDGCVVGATAFSVLDGTPYLFKSKAVIMANGNQNWGIMKMWSSGRGEGLATAYRAGAKMRNAEFGSFVNIVSLDHGHVSYEAENFMYNAVGEKVDPNTPQIEGATFVNACGGVDIGGAIGMVMYSHVMQGKGPIYENHAENDFPFNPFGQIIFPMHGEAPPEWYRPFTHKFAHRIYDKNKETAYSKNAETDLKEIEPGVVGECSPMVADEYMQSNIPGLYSAGDISANGTSLAGAVPTPPGRVRGFAMLHAVYTSLTAGTAAVSYIKDLPLTDADEAQIDQRFAEMFAPLDRMEGTTTDEIETRVRSLMQYVPYTNFKSEERLNEAMEEVEKLKADVRKVVAADAHGLAKAHACRAMVLSAEMFFRGSLERKETRGWHIREDYPQRDDQNMLKWIYFEQGSDGSMVMGADRIPMEGYRYQPEGWETKE
ncbi:MAG: FAD-binding protein [Clostridiales Family XIII bacterium]|jgi:succinate dehydrogenase/fumarate reductase flavoprotein subunit|nr:FAD-binding protein [Clostridiales Family XIII bacterium]